MNKENFDSFIKNHYPDPENFSNLKISDEALNRIVQLNKSSSCTKVTRKILIARLLVLLLLALGFPITAYAATTLYSFVYEKVKNTNISEDKLTSLVSELDEQGFSQNDVNAMDSLKVNEYGQTYGPDALGAELVAVQADNNKHGYVYRNELEQDDINTPEEAAKNSNTARRIKVYKSDGRTVIGYFTLGSPKVNK